MAALPDYSPLQWALLIVLLLLALLGLYYVSLLVRGYRCLPLSTTNCEGGKPHHLVYVTGPEKAALAKIAKHTGPPPPCHGIDSYPQEKRKRTDEAPTQDPDMWAEDNEEYYEGVRYDSADSSFRFAQPTGPVRQQGDVVWAQPPPPMPDGDDPTVLVRLAAHDYFANPPVFRAQWTDVDATHTNWDSLVQVRFAPDVTGVDKYQSLLDAINEDGDLSIDVLGGQERLYTDWSENDDGSVDVIYSAVPRRRVTVPANQP